VRPNGLQTAKLPSVTLFKQALVTWDWLGVNNNITGINQSMFFAAQNTSYTEAKFNIFGLHSVIESPDFLQRLGSVSCPGTPNYMLALKHCINFFGTEARQIIKFLQEAYHGI
jgi:hypothetical protein